MPQKDLSAKTGICSDANKKYNVKSMRKYKPQEFSPAVFLCPAIYRNTAIGILLYYDGITNLFHL